MCWNNGNNNLWVVLILIIFLCGLGGGCGCGNSCGCGSNCGCGNGCDCGC